MAAPWPGDMQRSLLHHSAGRHLAPRTHSLTRYRDRDSSGSVVASASRRPAGCTRWLRQTKQAFNMLRQILRAAWDSEVGSVAERPRHASAQSH